MKTFRVITILLISAAFLFTINSCAVVVKPAKGNHNGWFKNPNNPHHFKSTNPGHNKHKNKHSKGKKGHH